jgi:Fic-DOC domain mobile mystery protein B
MTTGTESVEATIGPDERELLLPSLSTRAQLEEVERIGILAARVWAMRDNVLQRGDLITEKFCRELHRRMFGAVWRGAGTYRTRATARGWEPARIAEGVGLFMDDADGWLAHGTHPIPEAAVRLHHRLVSVRPWAKGNGRHARLMADVIVAAHGERPLGWGARSGGGERVRGRYLEAIRAADDGDMAALVAFASG